MNEKIFILLTHYPVTAVLAYLGASYYLKAK
jgi:hypothetical protein